mmetsp:Transcript_47598/g.74327  ORF Transcript_47598/g.74327 Transcript_47598/m.74327 type:complete len:90 (-) Transcript_47598:93-362(-)
MESKSVLRNELVMCLREAGDVMNETKHAHKQENVGEVPELGSLFSLKYGEVMRGMSGCASVKASLVKAMARQDAIEKSQVGSVIEVLAS